MFTRKFMKYKNKNEKTLYVKRIKKEIFMQFL